MEAQNRDFINIYALKTRQWALIMPLWRSRDRPTIAWLYKEMRAFSQGLSFVRARSLIALWMHWLYFAAYFAPVLWKYG